MSRLSGVRKGRDMMARGYGGILLSAAVLAAAAPASAQDASAGAIVFKRCAICHATDPGKGPKIGPSMGQIVGRKAGAMPGFIYSPAMTKSKITWTAEKLDAFVKQPSALVPGNKMAFGGIPDAKQRADLIAFLKTLSN